MLLSQKYLLNWEDSIGCYREEQVKYRELHLDVARYVSSVLTPGLKYTSRLEIHAEGMLRINQRLIAQCIITSNRRRDLVTVNYATHGQIQQHSDQLNPSNAEATFVQSNKDAKTFENHLNPVMLVFIR